MSSADSPFDTKEKAKRLAIVWFCSSILQKQMVTIHCGRLSLNKNWLLYFPANISTHRETEWAQQLLFPAIVFRLTQSAGAVGAVGHSELKLVEHDCLKSKRQLERNSSHYHPGRDISWTDAQQGPPVKEMWLEMGEKDVISFIGGEMCVILLRHSVHSFHTQHYLFPRWRPV